MIGLPTVSAFSVLCKVVFLLETILCNDLQTNLLSSWHLNWEIVRYCDIKYWLKTESSKDNSFNAKRSTRSKDKKHVLHCPIPTDPLGQSTAGVCEYIASSTRSEWSTQNGVHYLDPDNISWTYMHWTWTWLVELGRSHTGNMSGVQTCLSSDSHVK